MTGGRRGAGRRLGRDEAGVSTVLGAILLFGLFVVTLVTVQVKFVPVWDHDRESGAAIQLQAQVSQLKSDLDRLADNRTSVPVTDPVTLGSAKGFIFFTGGTPGGDVSFVPAASGGSGLSLASPQVHVLARGGKSLFAGSESWTQVITGGTVTNVTNVKNLRIRIPNTSLSTCAGSGTQGLMGTISLALTDRTGAFAGRFELAIYREQGQNCSFRYSTYARTNSTTPATVYTETFYWHPSSGPSPGYEYVDALRSEFTFADVIAQANAPLAIAFTITPGAVTPTPQADYTIGYDLVTGAGVVQVGGGGITIPNYAQSFPGGLLRTHIPFQRFPAQTFDVEYGAVIVHQADGEAMAVPPSMTVGLAGGQVAVHWTVPGLQGSASTVTGPSQAVVGLAPATNTVDIVATMGRLTATLATQHPAVWAQYFNSLMTGAGLTSSGGQPQFTVTTGTGTVTLNLYGLNADPNSGVDDLQLTLKGGTVVTVPAAAGTK